VLKSHLKINYGMNLEGLINLSLFIGNYDNDKCIVTWFLIHKLKIKAATQLFIASSNWINLMN